MRVLILGGTRYIGAHTAARLADRGHELYFYNRGKSASQSPVVLPEARCLVGDRASIGEQAEELRSLRPEIVVDMRPLSRADAEAVARVFNGYTERLVAISSVDVYEAYDVMRGIAAGSGPDGLEPTPLTEESRLRSQRFPYRLAEPRAADDPQKLLDDYDKIDIEDVYLNQPDLPATILRLPMVYGPGDYQHRLWEYLARMRDGRDSIAIDSVAAQWRACRAYVGDVAHAITLAVETPLPESRVFHLAENDAQTELDWIQRIGSAVSWRGEVHAIPAEYWLEEYRCQGNMRQHWELDSSAIRSTLGYSELSSSAEAIVATAEWEGQNPPAEGKAPGIPYELEDILLSQWAGRNESSSPGSEAG